jgi:hypothetical protein
MPSIRFFCAAANEREWERWGLLYRCLQNGGWVFSTLALRASNATHPQKAILVSRVSSAAHQAANIICCFRKTNFSIMHAHWKIAHQSFPIS